MKLRGVADEARELHDDRIVEAKLLAQLRAFRGGRLDADHHVDRIADEAEQRERDQRHREHHHDGLQQAANDEGEHVLGAEGCPSTLYAFAAAAQINRRGT